MEKSQCGTVPTASSSNARSFRYLIGETLHGLAKRHDASRPLIRVWIEKYEAGEFDDDAQATDLIQQYESIAALERLVGKEALELEFLKETLQSAPRPRNGTTSVITGPLPLLPALQTDGYRTFMGG